LVTSYGCQCAPQASDETTAPANLPRAEKHRTAVQGAIRLTFGRHEDDGTGRNVVLACWNKSHDRHIGGDISVLFAASIGHRHCLTVKALTALATVPFQASVRTIERTNKICTQSREQKRASRRNLIAVRGLDLQLHPRTSHDFTVIVPAGYRPWIGDYCDCR
jgi:hypothetical protein